jgi:hypothetical protein
VIRHWDSSWITELEGSIHGERGGTKEKASCEVADLDQASHSNAGQAALGALVSGGWWQRHPWILIVKQLREFHAV